MRNPQEVWARISSRMRSPSVSLWLVVRPFSLTSENGVTGRSLALTITLEAYNLPQNLLGLACCHNLLDSLFGSRTGPNLASQIDWVSFTICRAAGRPRQSNTKPTDGSQGALNERAVSQDDGA